MSGRKGQIMGRQLVCRGNWLPPARFHKANFRQITVLIGRLGKWKSKDLFMTFRKAALGLELKSSP